MDPLARPFYLALDIEAVQRIDGPGKAVPFPEVDVRDVFAGVADGEELLNARPIEDAARNTLVLAPQPVLKERYAIADGLRTDGLFLFPDGPFLPI